MTAARPRPRRPGRASKPAPWRSICEAADRGLHPGRRCRARRRTTVQTVLRAFGSKDELIYAALEEWRRRRRVSQADAAGRRQGGGGGDLRHLRERSAISSSQRLADERRRPALKAAARPGTRKPSRLGEDRSSPPQLKRRRGARARATSQHAGRRSPTSMSGNCCAATWRSAASGGARPSFAR